MQNETEELQVYAICNGETIALSKNVKKLPATQLVLRIEGHSNKSISIDGKIEELSAGHPGICTLDYRRSTGFHRLEVDGEVFWFATEDKKLGIEGIAEILRHLRNLGTGWSGQTFFSDGTGYRDPHVVYAWFNMKADRSFGTIESILNSPRQETFSQEVMSRRGGNGLLKQATVRLLRSNPQRHLNDDPRGAIEVSGKNYSPVRVIRKSEKTSVDTVPNRRTVQLLTVLHGLVVELLGSQIAQDARMRCEDWEKRASKLLVAPLALTLRKSDNVLSQPRQGAELFDPKYGHIYQLVNEIGHFGWSAAVEDGRSCSYVEKADQIYQVYAVHRIAKSLGLQTTGFATGRMPIAFTSKEYDLYYDNHPPATILPSWRRRSIAPDNSRPDIVLLEKATGRVAVMDAKYRVGSDGNASEESRKEVSAYMDLYGLDAIVILYPGIGKGYRSIVWQEKRIVEVPIFGPDDHLAESVAEILSCLQVPRYRASL